MKTEVLIMLFGFIAASIAYSMDWQREQDTRMSSMDKILAKQQALNELNLQYNQMGMQKRIRSNPINVYTAPTSRNPVEYNQEYKD